MRLAPLKRRSYLDLPELSRSHMNRGSILIGAAEQMAEARFDAVDPPTGEALAPACSVASPSLPLPNPIGDAPSAPLTVEVL